MPPLSSQPLCARQQEYKTPVLLTQTLTRATTTYTTTLALGPATSTSTFTFTSTSTSTSTSMALTARAADSSASSGPIIGAIMGAILGTLVLLTLMYKFCFNNRSALYGLPSSSRHGRRHGSDIESSVGSMSDISASVSGHRGGYLRRPERAYVKRRSSSSSTAAAHERRRRRKQRTRRSKATVQVKDGLLGFALRPEGRSYAGAGAGAGPRERGRERERERRKWYGHQYYSSRRTGDD